MPKRNIVLRFDLFGKKSGFMVGGQESFNTIIGTISSFIVVIVSLLFIIYYSVAIINRENQNLIVTDYIEKTPERLNFSSDKFVLAFSLQHQNFTLFSDKSIYTVNANLVTITRNQFGQETRETKHVELVSCSNFNIRVVPDYFHLLDLSSLYCIDFDKNKVFLEGTFGNKYWTYLNLRFFKCNRHNNDKCKSDEEIGKILSGGFIGMFISDYSVYPKQFNNPIEPYGNNIYTSFSINSFLNFWVYFKELNVVTNMGLVFDKIKTEKVYNFDKIEEQIDVRDENNNHFINVYLRLSQIKTVYSRNYDKLQSIAVNSGGIIQVCVLLGNIITFFFKEILFRDYIYSTHFSLIEKKFKTSIHHNLNTRFGQSKTITNESTLDLKNNSLNEHNLTLIKLKHQSQQKSSKFGDKSNEPSQNELSFRNKKIKLNSGSIFIIGCSKRVRKKVVESIEFFDSIKMLLDIRNFLCIQEEIELIKKKLFKSEKISNLSQSKLFLGSNKCSMSKFISLNK